MDEMILNEELPQDEESRYFKLLADCKWSNGFACKKCGNTNYCKGKKPYSRRCTRCKSEESATAHTIFHRCKMPLSDAIALAKIVCEQPSISTYELSRQLEMRQMTCWKFKAKVMECLESPDKSDFLTLFSVLPDGQASRQQTEIKSLNH